MKLEYAAQILRGWPADGALERAELIKQGSILVNGDIVSLQVDGTVDKVGATKSGKVGLVIRGNGDSPAAANANGTFMTPQPAKNATAAWSAGSATFTVTGHGYVVGNIVTVAGFTGTGANSTAYNGTFVIATVPTLDTFTVAITLDPGAQTVAGTTTLASKTNNSGKAVVLWGNYIVATSNFAAGAYAPGSSVTAASGKWALNTVATIDNTSAATVASTTTTALADVAATVGTVLRVQGASATETAHLVIVVN